VESRYSGFKERLKLFINLFFHMEKAQDLFNENRYVLVMEDVPGAFHRSRPLSRSVSRMINTNRRPTGSRNE